jgi:hypothetical protein
MWCVLWSVVACVVCWYPVGMLFRLKPQKLEVSGLSVFGPKYEAWISGIRSNIADPPTGSQHSAGRVLSCTSVHQQRAVTLPFIPSEHSCLAEPCLQLWEPQGNRNVKAPVSNNKFWQLLFSVALIPYDNWEYKPDIKVCDEGILMQLLCFSTLFIILFLFKTHNVSETGFCLPLQVKPNLSGDRD